MGPFENVTTASSIVLGSPGWGWIVFIVIGLFLALLLTAAIRSPLPPRWKWGLFALKSTAITLLAICLVDPLMTRHYAKPGENIFAIIADQSASLQILTGEEAAQLRGARYKELLTNPDAPWFRRLEQDFQVRDYTYGTTLAGVDNFLNLTFDDSASHLATALQTLKRRYQGQPLAGVLLFTDGNSTDDLTEADQLGIPVYPVIIGEEQTRPDIGIESVSVSQTNFEDAPVTVQARFSTSGQRPEKLVATLSDLSPNSTESQTVTLSTTGQSELVARFQIRPKTSGPLFYDLAVTSDDETNVLENPETSREATVLNNTILVSVNRDPHRSRILYVGGRPNWEHKFLGRALSEDQQLQLVSLIRIAKKEAKFDFRGRVGESNNSLFRGFKGETDQEAEDYSQPVLVRINTRDAGELNEGFPKSMATLFEYDAIIIDDTEAEFFTRDQQSLIEKFVSERGGGLLMLGGRDSFKHGKWDRSPVANTLPVYLNRTAAPLTGNLRWSLTRDGWLEPWTRSRDTEQAEKSRLDNVPDLTIISSSSEIKPGARTLATVRNESDETHAALVIHSFGQGRTAALLTGDLWRWKLQDSQEKADDAGKFWRQLARWLVGDVPRRIAISHRPTQLAGQPAATLRVQLRDQEYQPLDGEHVQIEVRLPDGKTVQVDAQPCADQAGTYEAIHVSRLSGAYTARATTTDSNGKPLTAEIGWASNPTAQEFRKADINLKDLTKLADATGGQIVKATELEDFVSTLPFRNVPIMQTEMIPLWHRPWILLIALALLTAEWGLRRWGGLA
ncbi:glutamine amidotransferase [Planctomicrobium sp. SH527]|uniref:glutamine amidotransferase n=1 Tax=Planctomicrobium sp. SH527 TaxID=3448123 RepID=UPI003F5C9A75